MKKIAYNPHHCFSLLDAGIHIRKKQLIENCIRQTTDYKQYKAYMQKKEEEETRKKEREFEILVYGKVMNY
jgi:hypothetical protein